MLGAELRCILLAMGDVIARAVLLFVASCAIGWCAHSLKLPVWALIWMVAAASWASLAASWWAPWLFLSWLKL